LRQASYLAEFGFRYSNRITLGIANAERTCRAIKAAGGKRALLGSVSREDRFDSWFPSRPLAERKLSACLALENGPICVRRSFDSR
jgi:hypothetical protein